MARDLRPQLKRFFEFISSKREGDVVSAADIRTAVGWTVSTLRTHRDKNALDPFLTYLGDGKGYRVRRDGSTISKGEISQSFTQIRPTELKLSPGTRVSGDLGDYELSAEIGRGAVAQVWRCLRILNQKQHAVKIVSPRADLLEPSNFDNVKQRFSREARNGRKLSHENIVTYTDVGVFKDHPFLVMELADRSVGARLKTGLLTLADALDVVESCARGLQYLHDSGCVHRDVKPDNILYFGDRVVLGDLGIVKWSDLNPAFTSAGTITRAAVQLGSWYYMAPEQRSAPHEAVPHSDIYSLGVSWYEMLTGTTPDPAAVGAQAFDDPTPSTEVSALIRKMLSFKSQDRPSADQILRVVGEIRKSIVS